MNGTGAGNCENSVEQAVIHQCDYNHNLGLFPWAIFQKTEIALFYRLLPSGKYLLQYLFMLSTFAEHHMKRIQKWLKLPQVTKLLKG